MRDATPPAPVEESGTPPFTSGPWLFAHNGRVEGFADQRPVRSRLRHLVSDDRSAAIEGASDSEVLFALTLDRLDQGMAPGVALGDVVSTVVDLAPARLNLVLTDGLRLAATVWGDSLFTLEGDGSVVVASEPYDDGARWRPVADRSLVEADVTATKVTPLP